ncbi:MAG: hypothetical protein HYY76_06445 [Acidobacteria bacterium]|nr:hypothetical protein [Acidobacteriota bacterium]
MNLRIDEPLSDPASDGGGRIVRELLLGRRRSRVPWVYVVYHRHARGPHRARLRGGVRGAGSPPRESCAVGCEARAPAREAPGWASALTPEEGGHVER